MQVPVVKDVLKRLPLPTGGDDKVVLELDLAAGVVSGPMTSPIEAFRQRNAPSVRAIRDGLRAAADDDSVLGLLVHVGTCPLSLAQADEVGGLIADFSEHKPSAAWSASYGELTSGLAAYRVAINAREVWVQPSGSIGLVGVSLGIVLLRGGLEKLGLQPEFGQRHEYKSAADQFSAVEVSPANREMMQRIADSIVDETVALVAAKRDLDEADVRTLIEQAPLSAEAARDGGLIDHLGYRDEVYAWAREHWTPQWEPRYVQRYAKDAVGSPVTQLIDTKRPAVAVVDVSGPIVLGGGTGRQAGADTVCARLREVGRDKRVKAVVLRVDSPGGSYVASDQIRREVLNLRESGRPVVASMGATAASGGYFVSMPADEIVAQPSTLTGSIGVLAGKVVTEQLLDKVGLVHELIESGPRAAMFSTTRPFTDDDWSLLNSWLDEVYADFTAKAAADRDLDLDVLEPLARGRVWTGADAAERSLVDHLGGSKLALQRASELAGLDPKKIVVQSPPPWQFLLDLKAPESSESAARVAGVPLSGPETLLQHAAAVAGIPVPYGVLSLPWSITIR